MIYFVDTNFLIHCWRNAQNPERLRPLQAYLTSEIRLSWIVKAEFLRGSSLAAHDVTLVREFLHHHKTVWPDEETINWYAKIYTQLVRANQLIGPHDLWIAATACQYHLPLLTKNTNEFRRVPGLEVVDYTNLP